MQLGMTLPHFTHLASRDAIDAILLEAEAMGWASVWGQDHIAFPREIRTPYPYGRAGANRVANRRVSADPTTAVPWWDIGASLAYAAAKTSRVRLGTSVLVLPYRHPLEMAKVLATIDALSGGRLICGVGVGWMREEFDALGIGDRFDRRGAVADECLEAMQAVWCNEFASHHGEFVRFDDVSVTPKPVGPLPLWIGGNGARAWRRVARFGDGWMPLSVSPTELVAARRGLDGELLAAGRDPAAVDVALRCRVLVDGFSLAEPEDIVKNRASFLAGEVDAITVQIANLARAGVSHLILDPWVTRDVDEALAMVALLGKHALPELARVAG